MKKEMPVMEMNLRLYSEDLRETFSVGETVLAKSGVDNADIQHYHKVFRPAKVVSVQKNFIVIEHESFPSFFGPSLPWKETFDRWDILMDHLVKKEN